MYFLKYTWLLAGFFFLASSADAEIPERTNWWKFDNPADLSAAEPGYGLPLELEGTHQWTEGPEEGDGASRIGPGSFYRMKHSISPKNGEKYVNEYSIQFDFYVPSTGIWHAFFQTEPGNTADGDFFINPSGNIGVAAVGYSSFAIKEKEWYRMVLSVKNGSSFKTYLDGELLMTGNVQTVDGRFSLDSILLVFADENGEDGEIVCSQLAVWDMALDDAQAKELGGFGHKAGMPLMIRIPFLQSPGENSILISWHDTASTATSVEFYKDNDSPSITQGSSEIISSPYRWHTVKLTGLEPGTSYHYRVKSGDSASDYFSFKTLPGQPYNGKLRFILLSDTHASDTTMAGKVLRAAREKIIDLYGTDIENHVNGIFHSGDITVSGNSPGQYSMQYFQPLSVLSANVPVTTVAGNHEGESQYFYAYMKLDDLSAFPSNPALKEKVWQLRAGNSLFIGLNTNIISEYGNAMAKWLDTRLKEAEEDPALDFVFLFFHHPPFSELWFDVSTFDGGASWVKNVLFPIFKKYSKLSQFHTGHTHGFERGTILSPRTDGDFRMVCGGGGGGPLDSWGAFTNYDYEDIHIAYDHYCFQILEIDTENHSFMNYMYSLGDLQKPRDSELLDSWYIKINQEGPAKPEIQDIQIIDNTPVLSLSEFSGPDSLMSVEIQVFDQTAEEIPVFDSLIHWTNIYGLDEYHEPFDRNTGIDLLHPALPASLFEEDKIYGIRVRYRDHNLKWSSWSDFSALSTLGNRNELTAGNGSFLFQNFPNPFQRNTRIRYRLSEPAEVTIRIYDLKNGLVDEIREGRKSTGDYELDYDASGLEDGIYFYTLTTAGCSCVSKMVKIN